MGTYSDLADIDKDKDKTKRKAVPQLKQPEEKVVGPDASGIGAAQRPAQRPNQRLTQVPTQKVTQQVTRKVTQVSKRSVDLPSDWPDTEGVEDLAYRLRKVNKVRVNADVPAAWKERLDDLAYRLRVGKYELMLYVIAEFLGEIEIQILEEGRAPGDGD